MASPGRWLSLSFCLAFRRISILVVLPEATTAAAMASPGSGRWLSLSFCIAFPRISILLALPEATTAADMHAGTYISMIPLMRMRQDLYVLHIILTVSATCGHKFSNQEDGTQSGTNKHSQCLSL